MSLLFDENLSPRLVGELTAEYPSCCHVRDCGLASADDGVVWEFAQRSGLCLVSKDSDFRQRSYLFGAPPKVIGISLGNCSTQQVLDVLRRSDVVVRAFLADPNAAFLDLP